MRTEQKESILDYLKNSTSHQTVHDIYRALLKKRFLANRCIH